MYKYGTKVFHINLSILQYFRFILEIKHPILFFSPCVTVNITLEGLGG